MTLPCLALVNELAEIRTEIARLRQRETMPASIEIASPALPVFRSRRLAQGQRHPAPTDASAHA